MREVRKNLKKIAGLWPVCFLLLGCEMGTSSKPKSPYRAPSSDKSTIVPGASSAEVGTSITVLVTVKDKAGFGISGVVPTITAVDSSGSSSGVTSGGCGSSSAKGVASCTIQSSRAGTFTVKIVTPVAGTGDTVSFYQLPRNLSFTQQPSSTATSETAFTQQPKVAVLDNVGTAILGGGTVTLSLTSASGATLTPAGSLSVAAGAADGIATFAGLKIDKAGSYTLTATLTNATTGTITATSSGITVSAGTASKLKFSVMPSSSTATGVAFATQPVIILADNYGNAVTSNNSCVVSLTMSGGDVGDTLSGSFLSKTMVSGVADYTTASLKVTRVGTTSTPLSNYVLQASGGGSCLGITAATSDTFTITLAGLPYQLALVQAPGTAALNETWSQQPIINVLDINGDLVSGDNTTTVILAKNTTSTCNACSISGSTAVQVVNGVAKFSGLSLRSTDVTDGQTSGANGKIYTYNFTGASPGLTITGISSVSQTITTNGFTPAKLAFKTQPQNVAVNERMTAIEVKVLDANGYFCANDNSTQITLSYDVTNIAQSGTMQQNGAAIGNPGTTSAVTVVNGVASITGISFTASGAKELSAAATSLTSARSSTIGIADYSTKDNLRFTLDPADTDDDGTANNSDGRPWTTQPKVAVKDKFGNTVTNDNTTVVTLDCVSPLTTPACSLIGSTSVTVTNGVADFTGAGLRLGNNNGDVSNIVIRAQASGLNAGYSATFNQDN